LNGLQHLVSFGQPAQLGRHSYIENDHTAKLDLHRLAMNQRLSQLTKRRVTGEPVHIDLSVT
jgi:hypothetical protein